MISNAAPVPIGYSTQIVVVGAKRHRHAEVVGEHPLDDLLLHFAIERKGNLTG